MMGAITQVRVLGGVIGLAIAQAVLLSSVRSHLISVLTPSQLDLLLSSTTYIASLPPEVAQLTRQVYGDASNLQMRIIVGFAGASLIASLGAWRRHAVEYADIAKNMNGIGGRDRGERENGTSGANDQPRKVSGAVRDVEAGDRVDIEL